MARPAGAPGRSANPFIRSIDEGRIGSREDLRRLYRRLAMKTHPDAVGSDRLSRKFIQFGSDYEEARRYLDAGGGAGTAASAETFPGRAPERAADPRLEFYEALHALERVDTPFNFSRNRDPARIRRLRDEARAWFVAWQPGLAGLYGRAGAEYDTLRGERPAGPYRKDDLYSNVRPYFHNVTSYHVLGNEFYVHQVRRNLDAVLDRLDQRGMAALKEYLLLLIADTAGRPACGG
jgi:hypothetical protein